MERGPPGGQSEYTGSSANDRSEGDAIFNEDLESETGVPDLGPRPNMAAPSACDIETSKNTGVRTTGQLVFVWRHFLPSS